jgi:hypothetical protein
MPAELITDPSKSNSTVLTVLPLLRGFSSALPRDGRSDGDRHGRSAAFHTSSPRLLTARVDAGVLVTATDMAIGICARMRVNGHSLRGIAEMPASMGTRPVVARHVPLPTDHCGALGWTPALLFALLTVNQDAQTTRSCGR